MENFRLDVALDEISRNEYTPAINIEDYERHSVEIKGEQSSVRVETSLDATNWAADPSIIHVGEKPANEPLNLSYWRYVRFCCLSGGPVSITYHGENIVGMITEMCLERMVDAIESWCGVCNCDKYDSDLLDCRGGTICDYGIKQAIKSCVTIIGGE